jgi:hypothetical protein
MRSVRSATVLVVGCLSLVGALAASSSASAKASAACTKASNGYLKVSATNGVWSKKPTATNGVKVYLALRAWEGDFAPNSVTGIQAQADITQAELAVEKEVDATSESAALAALMSFYANVIAAQKLVAKLCFG